MMPPIPESESDRLKELREYDILDTPPEQEFDDLTTLASQICDAPIALMTLVDADRQWFKSKVGMEPDETPRDIAFCAHALDQSELFVVPDACLDPRFADNPLVTAAPNIRFYAGAPLLTPAGHSLGNMCVIDRVPRSLSAEQRQALAALSRQAVRQLEFRKALARERVLRGQIRAEQERSDRLLLSIMPPQIAKRLKEGCGCIADTYDAVTVLFADVQDFARISRHVAPAEVVAMLGQVFGAFDRLCQRYGATRIKTVGDAYLAAAGLPDPRPDHAAAAADLALAMQQEAGRLKTSLRDPLSLGIGMHCGPLVAGVVGTAGLAYDVWGDTVNLAAELESCGIGGAIHVSHALHEALRDRYLFETRGVFYSKGRGEVQTYILRGHRGGPKSPF